MEYYSPELFLELSEGVKITPVIEFSHASCGVCHNEYGTPYSDTYTGHIMIYCSRRGEATHAMLSR